jgi:hypothetical protein
MHSCRQLETFGLKSQLSVVGVHFCEVLILMQNSCSRVAKNSGIAIAVCASDKNLKLFFALQTLNENGVKVENQPSRPA